MHGNFPVHQKRCFHLFSSIGSPRTSTDNSVVRADPGDNRLTVGGGRNIPNLHRPPPKKARKSRNAFSFYRAVCSSYVSRINLNSPLQSLLFCFDRDFGAGGGGGGVGLWA